MGNGKWEVGRRERLARTLLAAACAATIACSRGSPRAALKLTPQGFGDTLSEHLLAIEPEKESEAPPCAMGLEPLESEAERTAAKLLTAELERGPWDRMTLQRLGVGLLGLNNVQLLKVALVAGLDDRAARWVQLVFSSEAALRSHRRRELLRLTFERSGCAKWELTAESRANLRLPFHPKLPGALLPSSQTLRGTYELCNALGPYRFVSGVVANALRFTLVFGRHTLTVTTSDDLFRENWAFAERIDAALAVIPPAHLELAEELEIDPGDHPTRPTAAAVTLREGKRVSMFLRGAGAQVPQERLNETTAHEFGHVVSLPRGPRFWANWEAAIQADRLGVSYYGLTNAQEDFAEAYVLFLGGGRGDPETRRKYPNRFAILDTLF